MIIIKYNINNHNRADNITIKQSTTVTTTTTTTTTRTTNKQTNKQELKDGQEGWWNPCQAIGSQGWGTENDEPDGGIDDPTGGDGTLATTTR